MTKTHKTKKADPFDFSADFVEATFKEAVAEVREQQRQAGLDSYGTVDGKLVVQRPDGRVEPIAFNPKDTHG